MKHLINCHRRLFIHHFISSKLFPYNFLFRFSFPIDSSLKFLLPYPSSMFFCKMAPTSLAFRCRQSITPTAIRSYVAEFISTFFYVFSVVGASMASRKYHTPFIFLSVSLAFNIASLHAWDGTVLRGCETRNLKELKKLKFNRIWICIEY